MLTQKLSIVSILATILMGCAPPIVGDTSPDLAHNADDMGAPIDQQPSQPSCPAAAGIPGDRLLCADFSKISTLADPSLGNWIYHSDTTSPDCWQIVDGLLANKNLDTVYGCGVTLPGINLEEPSLEKLNRFTLSIKYKLDLRNAENAYMLLSSYILGSGTFLFYETGTGQSLDNFLQTRTYSIERSQLPSALNNLFKVSLYWNAQYKGSKSHGWQISSVAIIGSP